MWIFGRLKNRFKRFSSQMIRHSKIDSVHSVNIKAHSGIKTEQSFCIMCLFVCFFYLKAISTDSDDVNKTVHCVRKPVRARRERVKKNNKKRIEWILRDSYINCVFPPIPTSSSCRLYNRCYHSFITLSAVIVLTGVEQTKSHSSRV